MTVTNKESPSKNTYAESCQSEDDCSLDSLLIKCSHKERAYSLDVLNAPPTEGSKHLLRVIDDPVGSEKVSIDFSGHCGKGNNHICPTVKVLCNSAIPTFEKQSSSSFDFLAKANTTTENWSLSKFLKEAVIPTTEVINQTNIYNIEVTSCTSSLPYNISVESWKKFSWVGEICLGYKPPKSFGDESKSTSVANDDSSNWELSCALSISSGSEKWSVNGSIDEFLPGFKNKFGGIINWLSNQSVAIENKSKKEAHSFFTSEKIKMVNVDFSWPNLKLSGKVESTEVENDYYLDTEGNIELAFDPLIGATASTDILDWLIRMNAGFGELILRIKRYAAEESDANRKVGAQVIIGLIFSTEGKISGQLGWNKKVNEKVWSMKGDKSASIVGEIGFSLKGIIHAEAKVFYVTAAAGATAELSGSGGYSNIGIAAKLFASNVKDKPAVGGQIIFTGMAIKGAYYYEVGIKSTSTDKRNVNKASRGRGRGSGGVKKKVKHEKTFWEMSPSIWPKDPKPKSINACVSN